MIAGINVFAAVHGDGYMLEHPGAHFLDPDQPPAASITGPVIEHATALARS